jgi:hypothetical protein
MLVSLLIYDNDYCTVDVRYSGSVRVMLGRVDVRYSGSVRVMLGKEDVRVIPTCPNMGLIY